MVGNVRRHALDGVDEPCIYRHYTREAPFSATLLVAPGGSSRDLTAVLRARFPAAVIANEALLERRYEETLADSRSLAVFLTWCGALGLTVLGAGLYCLVYARMQIRQREYAIRRALGATSFDLYWRALEGAFPQLLLGIGVGLALSHWLAIARPLSYEFPRASENPAAFVIITSIVLSVGLASTLYPLGRQGALGDMRTLKSE